MELKEATERLKKDISRPLACGDIAVVEINDAETVLKALKNSIPKKKIEKVKKKIEKAMNLTNECIEESIVIADSDSLNFGRKQAHNYDIELLKKLLED